MGDGWLKKSQGSTAIVFVHGILSNSEKCWSHSKGAYWPKLVSDDPVFADAGVYLFTYKTGWTSGGYGVPDAIDALKEVWRLDGLAQFQNILFVCHSMGGIVVRKFIVNQAIALQDKKIGLLLLGSPSLGSKLASFWSFVINLFGHKQGKTLAYVKDNPWLLDLHKAFKNLKEGGRVNILGKELVEDKRPLWSSYKIVEGHSAANYFGDPLKVADSNHSSLAKPIDRDAMQYRVLADFFQKFSPKTENEKPQSSAAANGTRPATALFDVYGPGCRDFYFEREADGGFAKAFVHGSIWLFGPSGVGKTSIVKRFIDISGANPVEISLSLLGRETDATAVLREIVETLRGHHRVVNQASASRAEAIDLVCRCGSDTTFILFIDEVPVNGAGYATGVLETVAALLDGAKRRGRNDAKFVICSLTEPTTEGNGRFREQFALQEVAPWEVIDLAGLARIIMDDLPELKLSDEEVGTIATQANGSPRFVKTVFRNLQRSASESRLDVNGAVALAHHALKGF